MNAKRAYFPIVLINAFDLVSFNEQIDMEESKLFNEEDCDEDGMNASCSCSAGCGSDYSRGNCSCLSSCGSDYARNGKCSCLSSCGSNSSRE